MASPLQHGQAAQRFGVSSACAGKLRPNGPETDNALTIKPHHQMGARQRCKRKRLGLYLTPAMNIIPEMLEAAEAIRAERAAHDALRGDRSRLLRHVKVSFETLAELGITVPELSELREVFRAWPRSDRLISMSLDALKAHVDEARDLLMALMDIIVIPRNSAVKCPVSRTRATGVIYKTK